MSDDLKAPNTGEELPSVIHYEGKVVYMFAFDIAYEMSREPLRELLGQPISHFNLDFSHRSPRHLFFYRPQMVRLPALERVGHNGIMTLERSIKILPMGALSISVAVRFKVASIEELVHYHELKFTNGNLGQEVRKLAEEVRQELQPFLIQPHDSMDEEEAYTVFCIDGPLKTTDREVVCAEDWLSRNRRQVASLLTQEMDSSILSSQEAMESTRLYLSYYQSDVVVFDWDAALIVDEEKDTEEILYVLEIANLQLAELEAYDRLLDDALERSYRDLGRARIRGRRGVIRELRELQIDMARLSDELSNITKFFGDWHLAKIYENIASRFHLSDWHKTIDEKLKTLDNLYQLLIHEQNNRYMLSLEVIIVLLFLIDILFLIAGLKRH